MTVSARGIDVVQSGQPVILDFAWSTGSPLAEITTGTAVVYVSEIQNDGTEYYADFTTPSATTIGSGAPTTPTLSLTYRGSTYGSRTWSVAFTSASSGGLTVGATYVATAIHSTGGIQWKKFQYGASEGDFILPVSPVSISGCTSPTTANGTYLPTFGTTYNGQPVWKHISQGYYLWWGAGGVGWAISTTVGTLGSNYWGQNSPVSLIPYGQSLTYPGGSSTGTPLVSYPLTDAGNGVVRGVVGATVTSNGNFSIIANGISATAGVYNNLWCLFIAGNNAGVCRYITAYTYQSANNGTLTFTGSGTGGAFPATVATGDQFVILAGAE